MKRIVLIIIILISLISCNATPAIADEPRDGTYIGVHREIISPTQSYGAKLFLAGFGTYTRDYEGVHDEITLTVVAFEIDGVKSAIIAADVLGFDRELTDELRIRVQNELDIPGDSLLFNASHTHCAPNVLTNTVGIGDFTQEYADYFYETAFECIKQAFEDLTPGQLYFGSQKTSGIVAVNRRYIRDGVCYWGPWYEGPRDDNAYIIHAVCDNKTRAVLFSYAGHPTIYNGPYVSAEYVGYARNYIEEKIAGAVSVFMQGCGGDLKGNHTNADKTAFAVGGWDELARIGAILGKAVVDGINNGLEPVTGKSEVSISRFELQLQPAKLSKAQYQILMNSSSDVLADVYKYFYENYDNLATTRPYSVMRFDLGSNLTLIAMEGEVSVEYAPIMKELLPDREVFVLGYSNGEPGYICLERQYAEGGYETEDSMKYYKIAEGYAPDSQYLIIEKAMELCK